MPKKSQSVEDPEDMLPEYDFTNSVRGMFANSIPKGSRVVLLDPDVAEVFPTQEAANEALRDLATIIHRASKPPKQQKVTKPKTKAAVLANVVK